MNFQELNRIAFKYGKFSLKEFYTTKKRDYVIYSFNDKSRELHRIDGVDNAELNDLCTSHFPFTNSSISAAYKNIDDSNISKIPVDAYLVNERMLENCYDTESYELIIFHEIVHFLEKTKLFESLNLTFDTSDLEIGMKINEVAQDIMLKMGGFVDPDHNELFGKLLNYFFRNFDPKTRHTLLGKAMEKNFLDDYSQKFK